MPLVLRTSRANLDLVEIAMHIARENPAAAERWLETIEERCQALAKMPDLGRNRSNLAANLRGLSIGNYVVFYRPVKEGIQVIRVLHGARDIPPLVD